MKKRHAEVRLGQDLINSGKRFQTKINLGEHGSSPACGFFRAHSSPIDRAAWLSGNNKSSDIVDLSKRGLRLK